MRLTDFASSACAKRSRRMADISSRDPSTPTPSIKRKAIIDRTPMIRIQSTGPVSPPISRDHSLEATPELTTLKLSKVEQPPGLSDGPNPDQNRAYYAAHGRFAGDVAAAIDVRAGFGPSTTPMVIPLVDAPLFEEIDLHEPSYIAVADDLPPRAYADELICTYWDYIDSSEAVLDRESFTRDYEASYAGSLTKLNSSRDVWFSILNVIFALAVQRQEFVSLESRNEEGHCYFRRAWALLRPATILWEPGSLEMIQCLMLFNRYLHCTNNQEKTWMTAGLAMRMAQNICCHSSEETCSDSQLKQKVWASCLALDR